MSCSSRASRPRPARPMSPESGRARAILLRLLLSALWLLPAGLAVAAAPKAGEKRICVPSADGKAWECGTPDNPPPERGLPAPVDSGTGAPPPTFLAAPPSDPTHVYAAPPPAPAQPLPDQFPSVQRGDTTSPAPEPAAEPVADAGGAEAAPAPAAELPAPATAEAPRRPHRPRSIPASRRWRHRRSWPRRRYAARCRWRRSWPRPKRRARRCLPPPRSIRARPRHHGKRRAGRTGAAGGRNRQRRRPRCRRSPDRRAGGIRACGRFGAARRAGAAADAGYRTPATGSRRTGRGNRHDVQTRGGRGACHGSRRDSRTAGVRGTGCASRREFRAAVGGGACR